MKIDEVGYWSELKLEIIRKYALANSTILTAHVISCAPCNFGRMHYSLEEVGLIDPRTREPVRSTWDGLERFH